MEIKPAHKSQRKPEHDDDDDDDGRIDEVDTLKIKCK